eukprot:CAMPEP_0194257886 /NCGR_PEP_ID=MMETSP0158-20130606/40073_1 /TAXON_ID=33649 /ORGANISM="Thalassionema nitzschioides, Strain L26-B" /LENGTH=205 /DNA_ID=CAMNT_0038997071 /DNA_START=216 /DNA_END=830 /DNA_ORIENTATION=+
MTTTGNPGETSFPYVSHCILRDFSLRLLLMHAYFFSENQQHCTHHISSIYSSKMAQRTVLDEGSASTTSIEPHPDDVLLGRKANAFNHPGNQRYRHLITQNLRKYSKCKTRLNKGILTEQVTSEIVDGGRVKFLRLQESCKKKKEGGEIWKEVPYRTIQGKVAHALRDGVTKMTFPTDCDSSTAEKNTVPRINYCNEPCRVQQNL